MTSIHLATATPSWRDSQGLLVLTKWVWGELTFVGSLGVEFSLNGLESLEWEDLGDTGR